MTHAHQMRQGNYPKDRPPPKRSRCSDSRLNDFGKFALAELITNYVIDVSKVVNEVREIERRLKH